jgi:RHS repeat-associated protein
MPLGQKAAVPLNQRLKLLSKAGEQIPSLRQVLAYGARYYDPELGRLFQPDTIIPDLSNPQSYNRYAYTLINAHLELTH